MNSKIATREIALGKVLQKSTTLRSLKLEKPVLRTSTSCGCTAARTKDGQLIITYNAPEFPRYKQVLGESSMEITKQITVMYMDDTKEIITLKATIIP